MGTRGISRREALTFGGVLIAGSASIMAGGTFYATKLEPNWVEIKHIPLKLTKLSPAYRGFRLAQVSDIHLDGKWMDLQRLANLVNIINKLDVDIVVFTGDFVTGETEINPQAVADILGLIRVPRGCVSVMGNHDYWTNYDLIRQFLRIANIHDISNSSIDLQYGDDHICIAGVDDVGERRARFDNVLDRLPENIPVILLVHEPDFADVSAQSGRIDLQLSGHSHGGQVIVPGLGPFVLPYLGRKYPIGLRKVNDMYLYTNRGIGMVEPYVRINCRPEITIFTFCDSSV